MDERSLIKKAVAGDKEAFAALYALYKDRLYRYAYFRLGNEEDAEDAVSSCIIQAYESVYSLKYEKAFPSWILRILYRCCCALAKERMSVGVRADEQELDDVPANENGALSPEVKEAFEVLRQEDRDIVLLSVVAGYTSREIASIMSLRPSTVRSRLSRSLLKMRNFLSAPADQPANES